MMKNETPLSASDEKLDKIRAFWNEKAADHGSNLAATTPDPLLKELEIDALRRALDPDRDTLEVGCGNGYNIFSLAESFSGRLVGIDYAEKMVAAAKSVHKSSPHQNRISFFVGDVLGDLSPLGVFPQIYLNRCLINLTTVELQIAAVENLSSMLLPGGRLALLECSQDSLDALNDLRKMADLDPISLHWHNKYLDEEVFLSRTPSSLRHISTDCFSSFYYVASRVLNAAITPPGHSPDYLSKINQISRKLPSMGDYGPHKLFLFEKVK